MNSKTKHTPGPWITEEGWRELGRITVSAATTKTAKERGLIASTDGTPFREQEQANARLIAAAPELLAALKIALGQMEESKPLNAVHMSSLKADIEIVRAAIAKATATQAAA